jgi:hypothetical protein
MNSCSDSILPFYKYARNVEQYNLYKRREFACIIYHAWCFFFFFFFTNGSTKTVDNVKVLAVLLEISVQGAKHG